MRLVLTVGKWGSFYRWCMGSAWDEDVRVKPDMWGFHLGWLTVKWYRREPEVSAQ